MKLSILPRLPQVLIAALSLPLAAGPCLAQAEAAPTATAAPSSVQEAPAAPAAGVGAATRRLLAIQAASATAARPISGTVATLSYQRYLDSFKQPVPATSPATPPARAGAK
ncbi:MAG: DUF3613 domain-containing protein [Comamonadaceae bacterium]|nr:MAG: DUF3613 domain-containing protein [Comamonadaceae bacterium]